jgi:hypothetical protein
VGIEPRKILNFGMPTLCIDVGRQYRVYRYREVHSDPARSKTPGTYGNTSHENREIPCPPTGK